MADYNLGKAHGTVKVDYDGRGVRQADDDLNDLGRTSEETSHKITSSTETSSRDYDTLAAAAKRLEQEVARAAAAEVAAHARAAAAHEHLVAVQNDSTASAQQLIDAQRHLTTETQRYEDSVIKSQHATRALAKVRGELGRQHTPDLTPDADFSFFSTLLNHLRNIEKSSKTSSGVLNTFRSRLAILIATAALASPAIAGVAVSLVSLSGLAGVAAGALAGLAAVGGTLATAMSGLSQIFKVANKQASSAGQTAVQTASQERAAARQIEQSIRGVRDAQENLVTVRRQAAVASIEAARTIIQAERQLADAQFAALRAQEELSRARQQAARQLEDLRAQLTGSALDERQAILDVKQAEADLAKVRRDPRSTADDIEQATINLERQKLALDNATRSAERLGEDQAQAAAKGIENSDAVIDAEREVTATREAAGEAAIAVAEAVVAASQQQIDAQRDIRNATEALADAQRDLAEAYAQAAEVGAGAQAKMADAMANVSPEARKLVGAILDQSKAWQGVKFAVQDALFAGLSKEVAPLANQWLPLLKRGMVGIATELHSLIIDLIDFLHQGQTTRDVGIIFENTRQAVHNVIPAVRALLQVFLNLATVGSSFLPSLASGFAQWAQRLAEVSQRSRETGAMQQWMQNALVTVGKLKDLLGNIFSIIGTVFSAFDQEGGDALTTLVTLTQRLEDFLKSAEGQDILHALGKTLAALAHLVGDVLIGAFAAFGPVFVTLAPLIQQFADILGDQILVAFTLLAPVLKIVAAILSFLGPVLVPLVASFVLLNTAVSVATTVWKVLNTTMKSDPFIAIIAIVIALATLIIENWDSIQKALSAAWAMIANTAATVWDFIKSAIIEPIVAVFQWMNDRWTGFVAWLLDLWNSILSGARSLFDHIKSAIVDPIKDGIDNVIEFFKNLVSSIGGFFRDLPGKMFDIGIDIILGLLNGLKNIGGKIIDFFRNLISDAVDGVLSFLGIGSPSKLFRDIGEFTLQGYLVGVDTMEDPVVTRMVEVAAAVANAANPTSGVPTATIPVPRPAPDTLSPEQRSAGTTTINTLVLNVAGNLDPTNRVTWRQAIKQIKKDIEQVDRSEQP